MEDFMLHGYQIYLYKIEDIIKSKPAIRTTLELSENSKYKIMGIKIILTKVIIFGIV